MRSLSARLATASAILVVSSATVIAAQEQRAVLELVVNRVASGEALVVLRGDDVLVAVAALETAGLHGFNGRRDAISGQEFVSLRSLAPDVAFSVNEIDLQLSVTINPELLGRTARDLSGGAPADLVYRSDTSTFVNYSANWHSSGAFDLFAESATNVRGVSIYSTVSTDRHIVKRGLTNVTFDQRKSLRRWTVGDSFADGGPLGGGVWVAGLSVSKEFAIDPYYVRHPTLSMSAPIMVPSVMDVYVNGRIVSQQRVEPGRLDLRNVPVTMGRNDARVVVRDAFGQTQELSAAYYLATTALAQGVHDYQYHVGFRRVGIGERNWDYRGPVMLARHRAGVTDSFTAGGRLELEPGHLLGGGPSVNIRVPFGETEVTASASNQQQHWGTAAQGSFTYTGRPVSAGGTVMFASPRYATLTPASTFEHLSRQASAFASVGLRRVSATLQHAQAKLTTGTSRERSSLLVSVPVERSVEFVASVAQVDDERGARREAYAGITVLFGRSSVSLAHIRDVRGDRLALDAQRPTPVGAGYGYQLRAEEGPDGALRGVARYQGAHGRYELRQETLGSHSTTTLSMMGAVVGIGGGIHATRPVEESFALVRVPGVEGVRTFASHQEIGTTSSRGELLVPDLRAYYGNILNIADGDIPLQYALSTVSMTLAPPYRGGAVALFGVQRVQRVTGRIQFTGEDRPHASGELTVMGSRGDTYESPVGNDGSFYLENLPPGPYSGTVMNRGATCHLTMNVPVAADIVIKLGTLPCRAAGDQP